MAQIIYDGSDTTIEVVELRNGITGEYLDSATVTVTLKDEDGVEVAGASWPLTMSYVTGSDGKYRANLPDTLSLVRRARYTAHVSADAGAGLMANWETQLVCQQRK